MSWTSDGFRCYAHARVITDFKNMADYHEERTLKASKNGGGNEDKNDCHKTSRDSWEEINAGKGREARKIDSGLKHKTSLLIYCLH